MEYFIFKKIKIQYKAEVDQNNLNKNFVVCYTIH